MRKLCNVILISSILYLGCTNKTFVQTPKKEIHRGIESVSLDSNPITVKFGKYNCNSANEWSSIPGVNAKIRTIEKDPKIVVTFTNRGPLNFWLIKLEQEAGYRFFYVAKKLEFNGRYSVNPTGKPLYKTIDINKRRISPGVWEVTPVDSLEPGEYAIMEPCGVDFDRGQFGSYDEYMFNLGRWVSGDLWDFGIDD